MGLLYDPNKFRDDGLYRIRDLDQVVRFRACKPPSFNHGVSQFDGGFVVTRKQCVHFTVSIPSGRRYQGSFQQPQRASEPPRLTRAASAVPSASGRGSNARSQQHRVGFPR